MRAMLLETISAITVGSLPLRPADLPDPEPGNHEILIEVAACGVCHTELDEIEGRTPPAKFPVIPGHQVVGKVVGNGACANRFHFGDRIGVGWFFSSCGACRFCKNGLENLCRKFKATGRDADGGYAYLMTVPEESAVLIPDCFSDLEAAPLLCAGAIGYRSVRLTGIKNGDRLGLTGFGASAHLVLKMIRRQFPDTEVFVFARNPRERAFAMELGAAWAGDIGERPPVLIKAVIDTTPAWKPVIEALRVLEPGGRLVINAIRKESLDKEYLLRMEYPEHLWMEKEIKSVANVSRRDISEFLELAAAIPLIPETEAFPLEDANRALVELKLGKVRGAKVLAMDR